jgi:hypothetical protein
MASADSLPSPSRADEAPVNPPEGSWSVANYATLDASGKCADAACGLFFGGND